MRGLCIFLFSVLSEVASQTLTEVFGFTGRNVTLPCGYDVQAHGLQTICWGQGKVPRFQCSNTVLTSEDGRVQNRLSPRYQLLGSIADGDVSLTILDAQSSDAGVYGCRVEIPGWFNDLKFNVLLVLEEAPVNATTSVTAERHQEKFGTSTSVSTNTDDSGQTLEITGHVTSEANFKASVMDVGNLARIGAIFFSSIVIILSISLFRRRFQPAARLQHVGVSVEENVYESIPAVRER